MADQVVHVPPPRRQSSRPAAAAGRITSDAALVQIAMYYLGPYLEPHIPLELEMQFQVVITSIGIGLLATLGKLLRNQGIYLGDLL